MKANIDEEGLLTIQSESPLEAYALSQWLKANAPIDGKQILFITKSTADF